MKILLVLFALAAFTSCMKPVNPEEECYICKQHLTEYDGGGIITSDTTISTSICNPAPGDIDAVEDVNTYTVTGESSVMKCSKK
jgi:hypothetical protein